MRSNLQAQINSLLKKIRDAERRQGELFKREEQFLDSQEQAAIRNAPSSLSLGGLYFDFSSGLNPLDSWLDPDFPLVDESGGTVIVDVDVG